jgi:hypothetical protein
MTWIKCQRNNWSQFGSKVKRLFDPRKRARTSLLEFTKYTKPDYWPNWHHEKLAEKLDRVARGLCRWLMIVRCKPYSKPFGARGCGNSAVLGRAFQNRTGTSDVDPTVLKSEGKPSHSKRASLRNAGR